MKELIVEPKFNNKKLDMFLFGHFPALSSSTFYKTLRKKDIRINDVKVNENIILSSGDNVKVYISDQYLLNENILNEKLNNLDIIFEDDNILIINKSSNIEVTGENSLTSLLQKKYHFIEPCHRLDRNTTGLVLYAKSQTALDILLAKFKNHEIEKHYIAEVYGIPKENEKILQAYLFKDNKKSTVYISDVFKKGYVPITTKYKIIEKNIKQNYSVLDVELLTGKTHQIRAHLAYIGYPIIGDGKYGKNEINKKFSYKTQQLCSYIIKFNFFTDADILNYLNGKMVTIAIKKS